MSRVVLSIGSNMGDRLGRLQAAVDAMGDSVLAVSGVYETDAWGVVDQERFLNAVLIADDPDCDARGWLLRAQQVENDNQRVRSSKWGPRTLDVDLVCCFDGDNHVLSDTAELRLPHPLAHLRAFVLVPWLAADPSAELTVGGRPRPLAELIDGLGPGERDGVRMTGLRLTRPEAAR